MEIINRRSEIIILIIQLVICKYKSINRYIVRKYAAFDIALTT